MAENNNDESGIVADLLKNYGMDPTAAEIAGFGAYFIPGAGNILAAGDAINSFRKGNIKDGLINTLFIIPGTSSLKAAGKALKFARRASKWTPKTAKKIEKAANTIDKKLADQKFSERLDKIQNRAQISGIGLSIGNGIWEGLREEPTE